jgi:hypothetical protein
MNVLRAMLWLQLAVSLAACGPSASSATPEIVSVYSTFAAEPWLAPLYECAGTVSVLNRVDDPAAAQIVLRVGEPPVLSSFAYQIDSEEILIVTHRQSPVQTLNLEGTRALFSGLSDPSMQVWVYASDADVQEVFGQLVMEGRIVSPLARVAVHPQQMSDTLVNETNTVGILPRRWKAGDSREVFSAGTVPVLAITVNEPQGVIKEILTCLQK